MKFTAMMENGKEGGVPHETIAEIFFIARHSRGWSLRAFEAVLEKKVSFAVLARIERGEILIPNDEILTAIAPYTQPQRSREELKLIALFQSLSPDRKISYDVVYKVAQALSRNDKAKLIQELSNDLANYS